MTFIGGRNGPDGLKSVKDDDYDSVFLFVRVHLPTHIRSEGIMEVIK